MNLLTVLVVICSNRMAKSSSSQVPVEEEGTSGSQGVGPAKTMGELYPRISFLLVSTYLYRVMVCSDAVVGNLNPRPLLVMWDSRGRDVYTR
jgi:hypothetical protein